IKKSANRVQSRAVPCAARPWWQHSTPSTQVAGMSAAHSPSPGLPAVRITVHGAGRATEYDVPAEGFLIGSVPGCDLRLAGTDLPPVICLIARPPDGAALRKLSLTAPIQVNGTASTGGILHDSDNLTIGSTELRLHVEESEERPEAPLLRKQAKLEAD